MIESEWFRLARWSVFWWSRPSSSIVVGFDSMSPFCFASTGSTDWSSRAFALSTPLRKAR